MSRARPCSARLDQRATSRPHCGAHLAASGTDDQALNFGVSIAIYGVVVLVAALMLVGIPLLIVGVVAWVVLASLAAAKASQGQPYRYPLTLRLVR
jgi:uncharacterized Tic20 family protein